MKFAASHISRQPSCRLSLLLLSAAAVLFATPAHLHSLRGDGLGGQTAVYLSDGASFAEPRERQAETAGIRTDGRMLSSWSTPSAPSQTGYARYAGTYNDTCGVVARALGIPRVALLFLTVGDLPHDSAWQSWLAHVSGKLPAQGLVDECNLSQATLPDAFSGARGLRSQSAAARTRADIAQCEALINDPDTPVLFRQLLFAVYAHAPPTVEEFAPGSLLDGRRIPERVPSLRLSHTLVQVERHMLRQALMDELNERFIFLSESQVPLYPAATVYMQLLHEPKARIDACEPTSAELDEKEVLSYWRWKPELGSKEHWRKTSHWISMTRAVAEVVIHEQEVDHKFMQHCNEDCSNIEHYIPTMLATYALSNLTSCSRGTTYVDWLTDLNKEGHPRTFYAADVTTELMCTARRDNCRSDRWAARLSAEKSFFTIGTLQQPDYCHALEEALVAGYEALEVTCPTFIRKVAADAAPAVLEQLEKFDQQEAYETC